MIKGTEEAILTACHSAPGDGEHIDKARGKISFGYYWIGISKDTAAFIVNICGVHHIVM